MEKLKSFVFALLTNRLGIILATINLCFFASRDFSLPQLGSSFFEKIMLLENFPAVVFSRICYEFLYIMFPKNVGLYNMFLMVPMVVFFITFQWLFIGWLAKTLARFIRKNYLQQD